MNCSEIKKILEREYINSENELINVFKIYNMYLEYCDGEFKKFESILKNKFEKKERYLNWASKMDFIRENHIKPRLSKDQFAKDLSNDIRIYLENNDKTFNFLDRINKTPKNKFDKIYGFKTSSSIRHSLKNVIINSKEDVIKQNELESKFIENFCNIYNISYDWFMKKMYKSFEELELVLENEIRPIIKEFGYILKQTEKNKILSIINNSIYTINKEIEKILNEQIFSYSDEFLIILLLNSFEKNSIKDKDFSKTLLNLVSLIQKRDLKEKEIILVKAKLLSNLEKDEEVLKLLERNDDEREFINILAASYKRLGFKNNDKSKLEKSLKLYKNTFKKESNYYSLINVLYLSKILNNKKEFNEYAEKWNDLKSENNWWYFITNLEYLMLINEKQNLEKEFEKIPDIKSISKFEITSTLRQLDYFEKNNKTESFDLLKNKLEIMLKNPDLGTESHLIN